MTEGEGRSAKQTPKKVGTDEILQLLDRMEKVEHLIEGLNERTNTLVRLVDLMGRRVDRLEQAR